MWLGHVHSIELLMNMRILKDDVFRNPGFHVCSRDWVQDGETSASHELTEIITTTLIFKYKCVVILI